MNHRTKLFISIVGAFVGPRYVVPVLFKTAWNAFDSKPAALLAVVGVCVVLPIFVPVCVIGGIRDILRTPEAKADGDSFAA
jgi:hypothetical protein